MVQPSGDKQDEIKPTHNFKAPEPGQLTGLRRKIEANDYEAVEDLIWSNPRYLVTVCDSAVYLMAGPKYNACHIAARSNKPEITALILDTISNSIFLRKLYPNEDDSAIQDRMNHLLDSYLNTPDPRQGNTPLQFACKLGHHRVVRVLLTFEACDQNRRDSQGRIAKECICLQNEAATPELRQKIKDLFKSHLHLPIYRDQLKKRLSILKKLNKSRDAFDSDTNFSDDSFFSPQKLKPPTKSLSQAQKLNNDSDSTLNKVGNSSQFFADDSINVTQNKEQETSKETPLKDSAVSVPIKTDKKDSETDLESKDLEDLVKRFEKLKN